MKTIKLVATKDRTASKKLFEVECTRVVRIKMLARNSAEASRVVGSMKDVLTVLASRAVNG
jgi:hypothetical protein